MIRALCSGASPLRPYRPTPGFCRSGFTDSMPPPLLGTRPIASDGAPRFWTATIRPLLLVCLVLTCTAGEAATVLRGRIEAAPAGLTVAVGESGIEDPALERGRLISAPIGSDGSFAIAVPTACEQYVVTILRGDTMLFGRSHVKPGSDLGTITLPKGGGSIEGGINLPDGKPLAQAKLQLWRKHDNSCTHWSLAQRLNADAEGTFAITDLSHGVWAVSLDAPEWAPTRRDVTVGTGLAVVELLAKPASSVTGTVKDAAGKPVAGATVSDGGRRTATSAADGTYSLGGLGEGSIRLRATAPGLALADNVPVEAKLKLGAATTADLVLLRSGSLRVTVTLEDATAALPKEVQVELDHSGRGGHDSKPVALVDGVARLADLGAGGYQLQVKAVGTGMARLPVTITSDQELAVEVRLPKVYAYAGTLTLPEGIDRSKISVSGWVETGGERMNFSSHAEAEVDAEGRFRFAALETGTLRMSIKAPGCVPQTHRITVGPGGESDGTFALARGGAVRVRVVTADGKPVTGARARLDGPGDEDWNAESGDDGVAVLDGVADGEFKLTVDHDEWRPYSGKLAVPGDKAETVITLEAGLAITGTVLDADGKPIAEAYVNAWLMRSGNGEYNSRSGQSAADGTFRLAGLRQGTWQLSAHADGGTVAQLKAVAAGASGVKLQAKAMADLAITVLRPDGTPLPDLALSVDPEDGQDQQLTTGKDGRAIAKLRRGGTWQLKAKPEGFATVQRNGTIPAEGAVEALEIRLDSGHTLRGRLLGDDGKAVPGLQIGVSRQVGRGRERFGGAPDNVTPDGEGAFAIAELTPGPMVLTVVTGANRGQLLQRDVLIPAVGEPAALELRLPALGAIAGKLREAGGKGRASVMIMDPAARIQLWSEVGADGSFRIAPVPVGTYTVMAHLSRGEDGGRQLSASCTVTAGADTSVELGDGPASNGGQRVAGSLTLPEGVKGKMRLTLLPDPDRPLTAAGMAGFGGGANTEVAEDGSFSFASVAKGRHLLHLTVHDSDGWQPGAAWRTEITVADQPLELNLTPRGLTVPVRVLDLQGQPVEGAMVTAIPGEGSAIRRWTSSAQGTTAADGTASVRWLQGPMVCSLMVHHSQHGRLVRQDVEVRSGTAVVELRYAKQIALQGTVTAPAGAVIHLVVRSPDGFVRQDTMADEKGVYAFTEEERLQPGTWDVWAVAVGCAVAHRRIELAADAADATADFTLAPGGRIALRAHGGTPIGLEPVVRDEAGSVLVRPRLAWEKAQQPQLVIAPLEADGSGEIDGLPVGRWTVSVPGAKPVTVEVTAGVSTTADLRLE